MYSPLFILKHVVHSLGKNYGYNNCVQSKPTSKQ